MTDRSVLVLGGSGQIGYELTRTLSAFGKVVAPASHELDLRSPAVIRDTLRALRPAIVANAAGYTAVDAAESEPKLCAMLNTEAPGVLAEECRALGACLVHFSTDYVFDGTKRSPYVESDPAVPLNVYGRTKLAGEQAVAAAGGASLTFRTSWVYAARGRNFAVTMLRLARERAELSVVSDQIGAPTSAPAIARAVASVLATLDREPDFRQACERAAGIYHMTAAGQTTWFDFASAILAADPRSDEQLCRVVLPISTEEYPTAAQRPRYSVLANDTLAERFGVRLPAWEEQWNAVASELRVKVR